MVNGYWLMVLAAALLAGCQTFQTRAYQTLAVTQEAVEVAEAAFRMQNAAGKIGAEDYDAVVQARAKYQASMNAAIDLARNNLGEITPETTYQLSIQLIRLIERLQE